MVEKDVNNIDANFISLTNQNKDFQRLVEEAKAEKNKKALPALTIDTEIVEESKSGVRESKDYNNPNLPKPK